MISSVIDDYFAVARLCDRYMSPQNAVNRDIMYESFRNSIQFDGGSGNAITSYGNHIALLGVTKVVIWINITAAGLITVALDMLDKVTVVLAAIPDPVISGSLLVDVAIMIFLGLPTMQKARLNTRYTLISHTGIGYDPILRDGLHILQTPST